MTRPASMTQPMTTDSDAPFGPLLDDAFARAWADAAPPAADTAPLRGRLMSRVQASARGEAGMLTRRRRRTAVQHPAEGLDVQTLYQADDARRPGEPLRVRLIALRAGTVLHAGVLGDVAELQGRHREWLLVSGRLLQDGQPLLPRDYGLAPPGHALPSWQAETDALLFLRESAQAAQPGDGPQLVRDAEAGWPDFAPGIRRRVLWQRDGQAALLYHAEAGAQVPQHTHGHDEECLMVQGELFLDDLLLQEGDYQLAPAGTGHRVTHTDTGVIIYAHGDLDLQFVG